MNRDLELLLHRATPLLFGVFGHIEDADGERIVRVGGSGIFIAPVQGLTARHVARDLFRTDPGRADELDRQTRGYFDLPHSTALFQVSEPFGPRARTAVWQVNRNWDPVITDICYMEVSPQGAEAERMTRQMPAGFFEWSLLPPPRGSHVVMLGYPQTEVTINGDLMNIGITYVIQEGNVTDVYDVRRDLGMYTFPCFRIDKPVDHGFSGGPVFCGNRLAGIVSGGSVDEGTYAASLWPMCLMDYEYPDLGFLGAKKNFCELFERGVLRSPDWPNIKDRITKDHTVKGTPFASIVSSDGIA